MTKKQMESLVAGLKIQSKKDSTVYEIVGIDLEQGKVILDNGKLYTMGTIQRWYSLYEEEIPEVVEPDNTILDDIEQADELTSEQDTTADTDTTTQDTEEQTNTSDLKDTDTQVNEVHDQPDTTTKTHTTEGNTATDDKITSEDIIYIIEHSNCDAVVKKQYIGAYKEGYKGAVCMVRTTRKGNTHIDIKQGIFDSLAESIRTKLQTKYAARVYDKTRGYIRLFEVDDLAVLQNLILFVLGIA